MDSWVEEQDLRGPRVCRTEDLGGPSHPETDPGDLCRVPPSVQLCSDPCVQPKHQSPGKGPPRDQRKASSDRGHAGQRSRWAEITLGRGHTGQRSRWAEITLDGGHTGQRSRWTEITLDRDHAGQGSRWAEVTLDRDHAGQRSRFPKQPSWKTPETHGACGVKKIDRFRLRNRS